MYISTSQIGALVLAKGLLACAGRKPAYMLVPVIPGFENSSGKNNKYAIHAYTHGPVTGSGSSEQLKYVTHLLVAS